MRRGDKVAIIWAILIVALVFIAAGFTVGLEYVSSLETYFVFQNIIVFSYGFIGIGTIVALIKYFSHVSVVLITVNFIISVGKLYFLKYRTFHRLLVALFLVSIIYTVCYWIIVLVNRKEYSRKDRLRHINGIIPIFYVGFHTFIVGVRMTSLIASEISVPMGFIAATLVISALAVILGAIFIKDRTNRKEFAGKLCAVFFLTLTITLILPILTIDYTNYVFDGSTGEVEEYLVVDKYTTYHRTSRGYHLVFMADGQRVMFSTDKYVYIKYDIGDRIPLYEHSGAYDMTYYEYQLDQVYKY